MSSRRLQSSFRHGIAFGVLLALCLAHPGVAAPLAEHGADGAAVPAWLLPAADGEGNCDAGVAGAPDTEPLDDVLRLAGGPLPGATPTVLCCCRTMQGSCCAEARFCGGYVPGCFCSL